MLLAFGRCCPPAGAARFSGARPQEAVDVAVSLWWTLPRPRALSRPPGRKSLLSGVCFSCAEILIFGTPALCQKPGFRHIKGERIRNRVFLMLAAARRRREASQSRRCPDRSPAFASSGQTAHSSGCWWDWRTKATSNFSIRAPISRHTAIRTPPTVPIDVQSRQTPSAQRRCDRR